MIMLGSLAIGSTSLLCFEESSNGRILASAGSSEIMLRVLFPRKYIDQLESVELSREYRYFSGSHADASSSSSSRSLAFFGSNACFWVYESLTPSRTYRFSAVGHLKSRQEIKIDPIFVTTLDGTSSIMSEHNLMTGLTGKDAVSVLVTEGKSTSRSKIVFVSGGNVVGEYSGLSALQSLSGSESSINVRFENGSYVFDTMTIPVKNTISTEPPSTWNPGGSENSDGSPSFPVWAIVLVVFAGLAAIGALAYWKWNRGKQRPLLDTSASSC
jgi:hypothetical protein